VFANLVLADEINRAPAKVQSALLEAMQERQVTLGDETYTLPRPFFVLATQNPLEQEGTYPLPEAQVDRFMLKVRVDYPKVDEERRVIDLALQGGGAAVRPVVQPADIVAMRETVQLIYVDDKVKDYILNLVRATRAPAEFGLKDLAPLIEFGASPRATIFLALGARAHRVPRRPRLRDPAGRQGRRARRAAAPRAAVVRGRGRERRCRPSGVEDPRRSPGAVNARIVAPWNAPLSLNC
jgi:MoxR-like ATPase